MSLPALVAELAPGFPNLPPDGLHPDTRFRELPGWDSLAALSVIAAVDAVYGVQLDAEQLRQCHTVCDLANLAASRSPTP